jgi:hypothetical protein
MPSKLRPDLWRWSEPLGNLANNLWDKSRDIHQFQNVKDDPHEYGRMHVRAVEYNIWRLLFDPLNPAESLRRNEEDAKATPYEVFLLSAAACCHDFDKATKLPKGVRHGEQSGVIIQTLKDFLGLNDSHVEDINAVISIHGIDNAEEFKSRLRSLPTEKECEFGTFNLQRLALLLKAGDILHLDRSRISPAMSKIAAQEDWSKATRLKYLFRSHARGWGLQHKTIRVGMGGVGDDTSLQRKLERCSDWIRQNEWPAVSEHLQAMGFAYQLHVDFGGTLQLELKKTRHKYIFVKAKRYVPAAQAQRFLCLALKEDAQYPICRNGYTTHATGIAVARILLLAFDKKLRSFKMILDTTVHEFILETECNLSKLCEHVRRFSRAQQLFKQLIRDDMLLGGSIDSTEDGLDTLPGAKPLYQQLSDFDKDLESGVGDMWKCVRQPLAELAISKMTDAEQRETMESADWLSTKVPDVKTWFMQKKKFFSGAVSDSLSEALLSLRPMLTEVQEDWDRDYSLIQQQEKGMHRVPASCARCVSA